MTVFRIFGLGGVAVAVLSTIATMFFGVRVFVVQPIGAIPDGVTLVVYDLPKLRLVDTPDAVCMREQGYVNLLCRAAIIGGVAGHKTILLRLPYSTALQRLAGDPLVDG